MMKTKIMPIIIGLGIGIVISPVLGMAVSPTRNLILGLAPQEAILILAQKIDEQKAVNEIQDSQISSLEEKSQEAIQEEAKLEENIPKSQPTVSFAVQQKDNSEEIKKCQDAKKECEEKIKDLENEIGNLESQVEEQERLYDEAKEKYGNSTSDGEVKMLKYREAMLKKSEGDLKSRKKELQNITGEECKNYNKPC